MNKLRDSILLRLPAGLNAFAGPLFVAALALCFSLWHHFAAQEARSTFFGDSRHYLETCRQLVILARAGMTGLPEGAGSIAFDSARFSDYLMLDGPILPLIPAVFFALIGKIPAATDWQPFVMIGCSFQALTAALVYVLTYRLTRSRIWALLAGVSWGVYPAAIVASGRYLNEVPAACFLAGLTWSASRLLEKLDAGSKYYPGNGVELGVWNGVILLLKPALFPGCLLVDAIGLAFCRAWAVRAAVAAWLLAGLSCLIIPWAACSAAMTGHVYLTPQRGPVYNAAKGCDTESDGWSSLPDTELSKILCSSPGVIPTILAAWNSHPAELTNLTLRKCSRIWILPWNDFRKAVFGIPASGLSCWHTLLLILAMPGAVAVLSGVPVRLLAGASGRRASFVGYASLAFIAAHVVYAPFEAITRYGFTSMPFVVLLSTYGLFCAFSVVSLRLPTAASIVIGVILAVIWKCDAIAQFVALTGDFRTALLAQLACECLLTVLGAVAFVKYAAAVRGAAVRAGAAILIMAGCLCAVAAAFCFDGRHLKEWSCTLSPGDAACREVRLPASFLNCGRLPELAVLLIDGGSSCRSASVSVNGHQMAEAPELLLRRSPTHFSLFNIMRIFAGRLGKSVDEMRQWRVVAFPVSWLNATGPNLIRLAARESPITIYGDYEDRWIRRRHYPASNYFSAGMLCNALKGDECRLTDPLGLPPSRSACWLEHQGARYTSDLSAAGGKQIGQYRLFFMLCYPRTGALSAPTNLAASTPSALPPPGKFTRRLVGRDFDPLIANTLMPDSELRINKHILKAVSRTCCRVEIPEAVLSSEYLRIRISGFLRAARSPCLTAVLPVLVGGGEHSSGTALPATPPYLQARSSWSRFEICDDVPPAQLPGGLKALSIMLCPGAWEDVLEYGCDRSRGDACFRNVQIEFEPLSCPRLDDKSLLIY
jgi:hypothetical protein